MVFFIQRFEEEERERERKERKNSLAFSSSSFVKKNTLSFSLNRNGQGLVNGVGYSAADWSVTDTFSLAIFSKV